MPSGCATRSAPPEEFIVISGSDRSRGRGSSAHQVVRAGECLTKSLVLRTAAISEIAIVTGVRPESIVEISRRIKRCQETTRRNRCCRGRWNSSGRRWRNGGRCWWQRGGGRRRGRGCWRDGCRWRDGGGGCCRWRSRYNVKNAPSNRIR